MSQSSPSRRSLSSRLLLACGTWLVGLGFHFIFLRPALLPEDRRFMGTSVEALRSAAPGLEAWLGKMFTVMGGFMAGAGVLVVFVARSAMSVRQPGAGTALALAGLMTVALMSATNFALHPDFRWVLLVPALAWLAGLLAYLIKR